MMGGYGSTRWLWHTKKLTVEECRSLDVKRWVRENIIAPNQYTIGGWQWSDRHTGKKLSTISYQVCTGPAEGWARLFYTFTAGQHQGKDLDYRIPLTTTRPQFGGLRWWFHCPECGRRVGKLYLAPGAERFLCRHCHDLAYESAQTHDKSMDVYKRMSHEQLMVLLQGDSMNIKAAITAMNRYDKLLHRFM